MVNIFYKKPIPLQITPNYPESFPTNRISTTKYTIITFIPLCLLLQFKRIANIYFLITAIVQSIPSISPLSPWSSIIPLAFVLSVSLIRQAIEEYFKYNYDKEANSLKYQVWDKQEKYWVLKRSDELKVGMICKILDNQLFPADMIAINSKKQQGILYIQTSSLDGQKTLKTRYVQKEFKNLSLQNYQKLKITVQEPVFSLYKFQGKAQIQQKTIYLSLKNFLYRGSKLKNSSYVYCLIVYVGKYTKSMLNNGQPQNKMSMIQKKINYYMVILFFIEVILMFICGICRYFYLNSYNDSLFIHLHNSKISQTEISISSYFILLNTIIPISLFVSVEVIKSIQGYFITNDQLMQMNKDGQIIKSKAFRSSLNEELGMIQYVFTDKTGTLTKNQMVMKNLVIGDFSYETQSTQNHSLKQQKIFKNKQLKLNRQNSNSINDRFNLIIDNQFQLNSNKDLIELFLLILSVCHQCVIDSNVTSIQDEDIIYQGNSPDQIALVETAKNLGYIFKGNNLNKLKIKNPKKEIQQIQLLHVFQFTSDRKRMSVVLNYKNKKFLFMKGADTIIKKRLKLSQHSFEKSIYRHIDQFSLLGLRTLLFSVKIIPEAQYNVFRKNFLPLGNKNVQLKESLINQLQKQMILIGATAVEDKLQDKVAQTIESLLQANIKVCMLTGDKLETAQNIGKSCKLINQSMKTLKIRENQPINDLLGVYRRALVEKTKNRKLCLIVQGLALNKIISNILFQKLLDICDSIICCRVTPKDKASVVKLTKLKLNKIVLSIGDGANDVQMIQQANVGVGIYGNQGMNAVQASDYALPEFKALWRLLFVHGRWNYIRIAELIKYFFYKNIVFTIPQFLYAIYCGFSGTSLYTNIYLTLYNTIFTNLPVVIRALFEQDINYLSIIDDNSNTENLDALRFTRQQTKELEQAFIKYNIGVNSKVKRLLPTLYIVGQKNLLFTLKQFFLTIIQGIMCSVGIFYIIYYSENSYIFQVFSVTIYTSILFQVTAKLCFEVQYWTILLLLTILFTSLIPYILFTYVDNLIFTEETYGSFLPIYTNIHFYLIVCMASFLSIAISGVSNILRVYYWPNELDKARKQLKNKQKFQTELNQINKKQSTKMNFVQIQLTECTHCSRKSWVKRTSIINRPSS